MAFNGENGENIISKFGFRFNGQFIGYQISNIKNYPYRPKFSYSCIPNEYTFLCQIDNDLSINSQLFIKM